MFLHADDAHLISGLMLISLLIGVGIGGSVITYLLCDARRQKNKLKALYREDPRA